MLKITSQKTKHECHGVESKLSSCQNVPYILIKKHLIVLFRNREVRAVQKIEVGSASVRETMKTTEVIRIGIRMFTGDTSNNIHSPGPVIWEVSP